MNVSKTWIWILCFVSLFLVTADLTNAQNQWQYQENKHYRVLPLADTLKIENEQVEVLEIFAYSCNHCFNFESHLDQYDKAKPSYVNFTRMPVIYSDAYKIHARIYYAAESLGKLESIHKEVFKAIHLDRKQLMNVNEIYPLFEKHGVSKSEFENSFRSFTVESKLSRAARLTRKYKIRSTPTLVINGKYTANGTAVKTFEDMLAVTKELAQKEYMMSQNP